MTADIHGSTSTAPAEPPSPSPYARARHLLDEAHRRDPAFLARAERDPHSKPDSTSSIAEGQDELSYADAVEYWTARLLASDPARAAALEGICAAARAASASASVHPGTSSLPTSAPVSTSAPLSTSASGSAPASPSPSTDALLRLAARSQHLERFLHPRSLYPAGRAGYLRWRKKLYGVQGSRAKEILVQSGVSAQEGELVRRWVGKEGLAAGAVGRKEGAEGAGAGTGTGTDPGSQTLEDAAVLTFLEDQLAEFVERHGTGEGERAAASEPSGAIGGASKPSGAVGRTREPGGAKGAGDAPAPARTDATHAPYPREKLLAILRKTWGKLSPAGKELALVVVRGEPEPEPAERSEVGGAGRESAGSEESTRPKVEGSRRRRHAGLDPSLRGMVLEAVSGFAGE